MWARYLSPLLLHGDLDLDLGDSGGVHSGDDSESVFGTTRPVSIHRSKLLESDLTDLCRRNEFCHWGVFSSSSNSALLIFSRSYTAHP